MLTSEVEEQTARPRLGSTEESTVSTDKLRFGREANDGVGIALKFPLETLLETSLETPLETAFGTRNPELWFGEVSF